MKKDLKVQKEIMEAAKRVFEKWGVNKTTMEDIASEAGKGKSTLYYYYKSKSAIFKAVVFDEIEQLRETSIRAAHSSGSTKEKLKTYVTTLLKEWKKKVSIYPLVTGEINGNRKFLDEISMLVMEKEVISMKQILSEGFNSGEIKFLEPAEIDTAAEALVGLVHSLIIHTFFIKGQKLQADILIKLIINGI